MLEFSLKTSDQDVFFLRMLFDNSFAVCEMYVCMCVCMYVCMYVCMPIYRGTEETRATQAECAGEDRSPATTCPQAPGSSLPRSPRSPRSARTGHCGHLAEIRRQPCWDEGNGSRNIPEPVVRRTSLPAGSAEPPTARPPSPRRTPRAPREEPRSRGPGAAAGRALRSRFRSAGRRGLRRRL